MFAGFLKVVPELGGSRRFFGILGYYKGSGSFKGIYKGTFRDL